MTERIGNERIPIRRKHCGQRRGRNRVQMDVLTLAAGQDGPVKQDQLKRGCRRNGLGQFGRWLSYKHLLVDKSSVFCAEMQWGSEKS